MSTHWRWTTISPEINLTLTLDSDDPELIERVEHSARENKITLQRIETQPIGDVLFDKDGETKSLPPDYWETAE